MSYKWMMFTRVHVSIFSTSAETAIEMLEELNRFAVITETWNSLKLSYLDVSARREKLLAELRQLKWKSERLEEFSSKYPVYFSPEEAVTKSIKSYKEAYEAYIGHGVHDYDLGRLSDYFRGWRGHPSTWHAFELPKWHKSDDVPVVRSYKDVLSQRKKAPKSQGKSPYSTIGERTQPSFADVDSLRPYFEACESAERTKADYDKLLRDIKGPEGYPTRQSLEEQTLRITAAIEATDDEGKKEEIKKTLLSMYPLLEGSFVGKDVSDVYFSVPAPSFMFSGDKEAIVEYGAFASLSSEDILSLIQQVKERGTEGADRVHTPVNLVLTFLDG